MIDFQFLTTHEAAWYIILVASIRRYRLCFDTVGLVIRSVKIVPKMTNNVFGGMLNLAQSISLRDDNFRKP